MGSTRGIYSALSGAIAQAERLDTIANNIANVNTTGFKRDQQTFREYLTANEKPPSVLQVPKVPATIESFYDMQGGDTSYVDSNGTYTDFSNGRLVSTNSPLDVAIEGEGFFEILTPAGPRLTRNGSFAIDGGGLLVTRDGFPVLAEASAGVDTAARVVRLNGQARITEDGQILENETLIGRLSLVDVPDKDALQKVGHSLYSFKNNQPPTTQPIERIALKQGFLESSNVNIVQEMTDMIAASRLFESNQKAIQAYDAMSDKLVNVVPKIG